MRSCGGAWIPTSRPIQLKKSWKCLGNKSRCIGFIGDSVTRELLEAAAKADSPLHDRIMSAMAETEAILENEADIAGESREPGTRFLITPPLSITFQVNVRLQDVLIIRATVHGAKGQ